MRAFAVIACLVTVAVLAPELGEAKHSDRYLTAKRLNRGLAGSPMRGLGFKLEAAGHRHGISPFFMAAVAATESSLGRVPCRNNPRNVWGLGACGRAWWPPFFNTWNEATHYFARFLVRTWPRARTPHDFHGYAGEGTPVWASRTAYFMRSLFGVGSGVRYP